MAALAEEDWKENEEVEIGQLVDGTTKKEELEVDSTIFGEEESSFKTFIDCRSFRRGLVSIILLIWSCLMIPYDLNGSTIHGDYVDDRDMFISALYIWLIGHFCVIISSTLSLITIHKYFDNKYEWIIIFDLLLIMISSCLQVLGSILFSYSYCVNQADSSNNSLWASCISKSHGLYLLYNSGFITYLGLIVFATKYNGSIPLISLFIDQDCCIQNTDDNPVKFSKNFRISFLSINGLIGMMLILVFGYSMYSDVGDSYQAIYIGYTFMLIGIFLAVLGQIIFHCNIWNKCCHRKTRKSNVSISDSNIIAENRANTATTAINKRNLEKKLKSSANIEKVIDLAVYFLIYAGIVMIFMYSLVSKIPEASNIVERLRLIGNMIIITGTGIIITYELYTNHDNYDDEHIDHQYDIIVDRDQE